MFPERTTRFAQTRCFGVLPGSPKTTKRLRMSGFRPETRLRDEYKRLLPFKITRKGVRGLAPDQPPSFLIFNQKSGVLPGRVYVFLSFGSVFFLFAFKRKENEQSAI